MSAQINLYHARFLKVHDWLNLNNLALAAVTLFSILGVTSFIAHRDFSQQQSQAVTISGELETVNLALDQANQLASRPANSQIVAEVNHAQAALARREEIARLLESGAIGNSGGFSVYLLGFAHQVPVGLWLTGFTLGAGGNDMEIRGSTVDEKIVPDYIRRLGSEKIFQGRQFSALSLQRDATADVGSMNNTTSTAQATVANAATVSPAPTFGGEAAQPKRINGSRRPIHFVLTPTPLSQGAKP
ncbi:MAG: PilN domain-containing protein [Rugosibacter sp.]|nr:PilN domain-containing protein [Rugosibacter sp.]MDO9273831.1 PilN domain-containing protein [Rugosibacter sp.]